MLTKNKPGRSAHGGRQVGPADFPIVSVHQRTTPSAALAALLLIAPAPTIGVWAAMIQWPGTAIGQVIFFLCKAWMFALPVFWYLYVEQQRPSLSPARRGGIGAGAFLGIMISAVIIGAYVLIGERFIDIVHVREMAAQNGIGTIGAFVAGAIYWITINSLLEEFAFRWFIFRQGERLFGGPMAVLLSASLFTLHHVIALKLQFDWTITLLASLGIFIGGAFWSWLYLRYRSIWPCYISHAIVDIAVFGLGWWIIFGA